MPDLPLILEPATDDDSEPVERLNERVFGPGRFAHSAYRIRETMPADPALSFVARVGTLLVGPLIVEPVFRSQGIGEAPVKRSLEAAKTAGWKLVVLVGDEPYYARGGSSARRRARYRCRGRSILPCSFTASSRAAPSLRRKARHEGRKPKKGPRSASSARERIQPESA
jgi:predicted N-acetyltransferase YhbS